MEASSGIKIPLLVILLLMASVVFHTQLLFNTFTINVKQTFGNILSIGTPGSTPEGKWSSLVVKVITLNQPVDNTSNIMYYGLRPLGRMMEVATV